MTDYQKLNDLKKELLRAPNQEAITTFERRIVLQVLATNFGQEHVETIQAVQQPKQTEAPPELKPVQIDNEEYINLLENTDEVTDDDWKWFYQSETCTVTEAEEFTGIEGYTIRRMAGDKIRGYKDSAKGPWKLYRGSVILAKYDIPDSI